MEEQAQSCSRVSGSVIDETPQESSQPEASDKKETSAMTARVGHKAPDFNAPAYYKGGFTNVKLSDHFGKWIVLCFYPGDFTFV